MSQHGHPDSGRLRRGEELSWTRGETHLSVHLSSHRTCLYCNDHSWTPGGATPISSSMFLSVSPRCVTATRTVTVRTAGSPRSVRSKVTEAAWTVAPPGTVTSPSALHVTPCSFSCCLLLWCLKHEVNRGQACYTLLLLYVYFY